MIDELRADFSKLDKRYSVFEATTAQSYRELIASLEKHGKFTLIGFGVLAIAVLMGPHEGIASLFSKLVK